MLDSAARLEIHELAARYGNVIDAREWDRLAELHPVTHHVTNVEVLDGDPVRLRFKVAGPARAGTVGSADYHDVLRYGPEGWRIAEHHVTLRSPAVQHLALRRMEAQLAIQQLAVRYAQAVDARDLDLMVEQWNSDAWMGKQHGLGAVGIRSFFTPVLQRFYRSIHMIVGHRIDLVDEDTATGEVYCRAEHESGEHWIVQAIVYRDSYRRVDGRWGFAKRVHEHWYSTPIEQAPAGPSFEQWPGWDGPLPDLPHAWPSWQPFWDAAGTEAIAAVTHHPGQSS
ncbi:MAG: nuclear transport factor 2 family protein [Mycobacteriales bacterium]